MAADVAQFLWNKFLNDLKESESDELSGIPHLLSKFRLIRQIPQPEATICSSTTDTATAVKLQEHLYTLNGILAGCIGYARRYNELRNRSYSLRKWYFIRKRRKLLDKLKEDIKQLLAKQNSGSGGRFLRRTCPSVNVSRLDKQSREVEGLVLNGGGNLKFAAVGIVGNARFGKTSLARAVFSSHGVCQHFSPCIWLSLSRVSGDGVKIVRYILEELHYDLQELEVSDLEINKLLTIMKGLLSGRRYLLVLDDVGHDESEFWQDLCLDDGNRVEGRLSHGLPKGSYGAVMVISNEETVADRLVGKKNLFRLYEPFVNSFNVSEVVGLEAEVEKIEGMLLKNNRFAAVGIVGMGGTGKTALARKVFYSDRICKEFYPRISVCLSDTYSSDEVDMPGKILRLLLDELDYDLYELEPDDDENEKLLRILNGLLSQRRYLIVLDGVWEEHPFCRDLMKGDGGTWDGLSHGLPKDSGGAVIVTTRLEAVARGMVGRESLIRLEPACQEDDSGSAKKDVSWKIVTNIVNENRMSRSRYNTFLRAKEQVLELCDGLPLAATAVARLIAEQNLAT